VTKILGGDSHSIFPLIKDKNSLSLQTFSTFATLDKILRVDVFAVMPHTCDRMATPLGTLWTKLCFCLIIVFCLVCVFSVNKLILFIFLHALISVHICPCIV